ncbi:hypothetical protein SDC9_172560 [bioreactor metagenome]|uniref:Uncharacterized protein n=1 Tax=bioreactor metagenome TaxID=1076179 RepID=A0A645GN76_9ZZZZ
MQITQRHYRAQPLRQLGDRPADILGYLAVIQFAVRRHMFVRQRHVLELSGAVISDHSGDAPVHFAATPSVPLELIVRQIGDNPLQPRTYAGVAAKPAECPISPQKRLLNHLLRIMMRVQQRKRGAVEAFGVPGHQLVERGLIADFELGNQLVICQLERWLHRCVR